jgi:hypothetical protein
MSIALDKLCYLEQVIKPSFLSFSLLLTSWTIVWMKAEVGEVPSPVLAHGKCSIHYCNYFSIVINNKIEYNSESVTNAKSRIFYCSYF